MATPPSTSVERLRKFPLTVASSSVIEPLRRYRHSWEQNPCCRPVCGRPCCRSWSLSSPRQMNVPRSDIDRDEACDILGRHFGQPQLVPDGRVLFTFTKLRRSSLYPPGWRSASCPKGAAAGIPGTHSGAPPVGRLPVFRGTPACPSPASSVLIYNDGLPGGPFEGLRDQLPLPRTRSMAAAPWPTRTRPARFASHRCRTPP